MALNVEGIAVITDPKPRMNGVLRAYMLAILSKSIEQPGDRDWRGGELKATNCLDELQGSTA